MNKKIKKNCIIISLIVSILIYFFLGIFIADKEAIFFTSIACFLTLLFLIEAILVKKKSTEYIYNIILSSIFLFDIIIFAINTYSDNLFLLYPLSLSLVILFILLFFKEEICKFLQSKFDD